VRRAIVLASILFLIAPTATTAAGWHNYSSRSLGFKFSYPSTWHLVTTAAENVKQLSAFSADARYSITADVYPAVTTSSLSGTLRTYLVYARAVSGPAVTHYHWFRTTFARRPAEGTITYPATEGGVHLADGLYVLNAGRHIYSVEISTTGKNLPRSLAAFPAVYREIFKSWRFL
jgi:hypothetical protein